MKNCKRRKGRLTVIAGPMFSGKTTKLLAIYYVLQKLKRATMCFKADLDAFGGIGHANSHDDRRLPVIFIKPSHPERILKYVNKKEVQAVIIDETNFFPKKRMLKTVKKLLSWGIDVYANGLLYDYRRKEFGATLELFKIADQKIKLYAVCMRCGMKAEHTERISGGIKQKISDNKAEYIASCAKCHLIYKPKKENLLQ